MTSHLDLFKKYLDIARESTIAPIKSSEKVQELDIKKASAGDDAAYDQYAKTRAFGDRMDREASPTPNPSSFALSTQAGWSDNDMKSKTQVSQSPLSKELIARQTTDLAAQNPEMEKRYTMNKLAKKPKMTSAEFAAQLESKIPKNLREHIEQVENEGPLSSGDFFHIELAENEGIETWVIAEWSESVLIEADADTLKLLEEYGATFHDELTEAEYQGRNVPLGKRMPGDVKKSKVYVRKPNGKVVKVNFGDKKMKIKKSNPARRRSFRARHNCKNPGPRWKARYWSCRAW